MIENEKEVTVTLTLGNRVAEFLEEYTEMCGYPRRVAYQFALEAYAEEIWHCVRGLEETDDVDEFLQKRYCPDEVGMKLLDFKSAYDFFLARVLDLESNHESYRLLVYDSNLDLLVDVQCACVNTPEGALLAECFDKLCEVHEMHRETLRAIVDSAN